ncbi:uncharacterized protein PODANS_2_3690 [Podospora anserina S mat+]|uniref:Podospora anserina S mat+ genomic DNA chromosome 2, supercontig 2 n=2 Tax=Podospora TaxID=5144 RepID=B2B569_PODAN|nr:uncharacterized protein PODANS_2_3690 [Podospora anserina S mat+]KAK4679387.1 hypothetical protein QC764_203690 [Podospora pseudoanserina]CAP72944.1 unnamed protein product [Podospora anserina S mat+]CDP25344.1 Putative protein of unknown function [Podospora anserina S mat+]
MSSSRYSTTTSSTNPSKYSYSPAAQSSYSSSRPGQRPSPFQPPSQPALKPTHLSSPLPDDNDDDFSLTMPGIDPLSFFLTPPTPSAPYPQDDDTAMLDFDYFDYSAGIDDSSSADVRSVSPSSLAGFSRPDGPRPPTPPRVSSPAVSTPDLEFDYGSLGASPEGDTLMEEYYRHRMGGYGGVPLLLKDFTNAAGGNKKRGKFTKGSGGERHAGHHHVWREPSPDVWSIEEDPREEETGVVDVKKKGKGTTRGGGKGKMVKRVRFVLPGEEEGVY